MAETNVLGQVGKFAARYLRAYPLKQIAVSAAAWIPATAGLRLLAGIFGVETLIEDAVAKWSFQVAGAGLALLYAFGATAVSVARQRSRFRKGVADARLKRATAEAEAKEAGFKVWEQSVHGLSDDARAILRAFVDNRTGSMRHRQLPNTSGLSELIQLEWLTSDDRAEPTYFIAQERYFNFLLRRPQVVNSTMPSTRLPGFMAPLSID